MNAINTIGRTILAAGVSVAILSGCAAGVNSAVPATASSTAHPDLQLPPQAMNSHCKAFGTDFDQYVACQRADGTLRSFGNPQVAWRVRYFVRFEAMPCGEYPTVQEAYVFHAVLNDLNADQDLTAAQRSAVRAAMFEGTAHCP